MAIVVLAAVALILFWVMGSVRAERDHARTELKVRDTILRTVEPFTYEQEQRLDRLERRIGDELEAYERLYGD